MSDRKIINFNKIDNLIKNLTKEEIESLIDYKKISEETFQNFQGPAQDVLTKLRNGDKEGADPQEKELHNLCMAFLLIGQLAIIESTVRQPKIPASVALGDAVKHEKEYLALNEKNINDRMLNIITKILHYTHIRTLDLSENDFSPEAAKFLASITTVNNLYLSGNNLGPDGAKYFIDNFSVEHLDISNNNLGPEGAKYIAQNKKIRELGIDGNYIGPEGARALAANNTIEILTADNNGILDEGAISLMGNTSIKELTLSKNKLTDKGVLALASNPNIVVLNVENNKNISEAAKTLLKETDPLKRVNNARKLNIQANVPSLKNLAFQAVKEHNLQKEVLPEDLKTELNKPPRTTRS